MQTEASIFWPGNRTHVVSSLTLDVANAPIRGDMATHIATVLKLSDAIRNLEVLNLDTRNRLLEQLRVEAANALDGLGDLMDDPDSIRGARLRAGLLRGGDKSDLTNEIAQLDEQQLVAFCGNLTTWLGKSTRTCFSSFFAVPDPVHQSIANTADALTADAFDEIRLMVDDQLNLLPICGFKVTNLVAAAGEANLHPKHFAYFLPEDEGVKYAKRKRTVVFMNTYLALFDRISMEESRLGITITDGWFRVPDIGRYLIAWFRGHDIGHSVARSDTDFRSISKADRWASMVLQEVLADVYGFLLCLTNTWQTALSLDSSVLCQIYAFELLRYLRRAPLDFPDAGAAFVQLHYLVDHGYAVFDTDSGKISLSSADMQAGMTQLARELNGSILAGDVSATMAFASRYCPHLNPARLEKMNGLLGRSARTLDYVQSIYRHAQGASA